jgi:type IV pilus assembly protein PilM
MALSFGKSPRGFVGLDIDGAFLAAAQSSNGTIERTASTELAPGLASDGEVVDPGALSQALKDFFKREALPRTVRLGVANQQIVVRHLEMPRIPDEVERDAAVRFQAAEAIAMPLDEAVLDYQVIGESMGPDGAVRDRVVVVAARESMISRLLEAVRGAGLRAEGIDLNAFALVRTLAPFRGPSAPTEPLGAPDTARVFCHLGGVTNLAIAVGSSCVFTRPLSTVCDGDSEDVATSLAEEIRLSIDFHMAQPDARPAGDVLLSGPGAVRPGLADELGALIGLPVSVAEPLGGLGTGAVSSDDDPYRYTIAAGLALGASA